MQPEIHDSDKIGKPSLLSLLEAGVEIMKLICRKCQIEFPVETLEEVEKIQTMTCGADGGVHMLVGVR